MTTTAKKRYKKTNKTKQNKQKQNLSNECFNEKKYQVNFQEFGLGIHQSIRENLRFKGHNLEVLKT